MRRAWISLMVIGALLASVAPASAAADTYSYSVTGKGAYAFAYREIDGTFEGVYVEIADQAYRQGGTRSESSVMYIDHFRETCGRRTCSGEWTSGWAENVPFTIDGKLRSASVDVTLNAVHCTWDSRTSSCADTTTSVTVSWTGTGDLLRIHGTSSGGVAGEYQYTYSGHGSRRLATAAGVVDGFDLATADWVDGFIYSQKFGERSISHDTSGG